MKYTNEIIIKLPIQKMIEIFDNPENLKHWQPGLQEFVLLSGEAGQSGAKSRLKFVMGKRTIEMTETITVRDLPREFSGTYEANGVYNIVKNFFTSVDDNATRWVSENEFNFAGPMKLLGWFMPGMFKKQSQQYMDNFKVFAEEGKSVLTK